MYSLVGIATFLSTEIDIEFGIKEEKLIKNITCYDFMPYYYVIPFETATKTNCRWANIFMSYNLSAFAWFIACKYKCL